MTRLNVFFAREYFTHSKRAALVILIFIGAIHVLRAQAGAPDANFTTQPVAANRIVMQPDGKILLVGSSGAGVQTLSERLNSAGTVDTAFNSSDEANDPYDPFLSINGDFAYAMQFPTGSGYTTQYRLRRYIWSTGARDNAFDAVTVPGTYVTGFHVYTSGKVLVWGDVLYQRRADGTVDSTFAPITLPIGSSIAGIYFAADETAYIAGDFTTFGGVACNGLVRLKSDGTVDPLYTPAFGTGAYVSQVVPESSGVILAAYSLPFVNQTVTRIKANGTFDTTFHRPVMGASSYTITGETSTGKILLCGTIATVDGVNVGELVELNSTGTLDTSFATANYDLPGSSFGSFSPTLLASGKILLGGALYRADMDANVPFIRLNADGSRDTAFDTIPENQYPDIGEYRADFYCVQTDGKIVADLQYYNPNPGSGGGITIGPQPTPPPTPTPFVTRYLVDGNYPPHCPTTIAVDSLSPTLTKITWNAVANETGYQVQRNEGGIWVTKASLGASVTSYNDTSADGTTNFQYRVEASNSFGHSVPSPVVSAPTPSAFTTLTSTVNSPTQVTLSWAAIKDAWRYDIYRENVAYAPNSQPDFEFMTLIGTTTGTTFVDTTAPADGVASYALRATNVAGTSNTEVVIVSTPADLYFQNGTSLGLLNFNARAQPSTWSGIGAMGAGWQQRATVDLNGDGVRDILFQNGTLVAALLMNANHTPKSWLGIGTMGAGWQLRGVADINGSGELDLIFQNGTLLGYLTISSSGAPVAWTGIGAMNAGWMLRTVTDLPNNGHTDLIFQNGTSIGSLELGIDGTPDAWNAIGTVTSGWTVSDVSDVSDVDEDGQPELIFQSGTSIGALEVNTSFQPTAWIGLGVMGAGWKLSGDY